MNRQVIEKNRGLNAKMEAVLSEDARLLSRRAAGDRSSLAGKLNYDWMMNVLNTAAWQTANESAVLHLMPDSVRERYSYLYGAIGVYLAGLGDLAGALDRAAAIIRDNPDGNFSEEDTRELIEATHQAQGHLAGSEKMMMFIDMSNNGEKMAPAPDKLDKAKPATTGH
jgi:uncharacterized protein (DUF1778 family)